MLTQQDTEQQERKAIFISELLEHIGYVCYAMHRDMGLTHAECRSFGLGNDVMEQCYDVYRSVFSPGNDVSF